MSDATTITVRPNGPYVIKGNIQMLDSAGTPYTVAETVVLCRCGHSENKPFCDGTHKRVGFASAPEVPTTSS